MTRQYRIFRNIMIFWTLFIGIGAMFGGISMLIKPDGSLLHMEKTLEYFKVLPFSKQLFRNFIFPGISLIIVNGLTNILAFILIIKKKRAGAILSATFGFTLMLWITIQFIIFPANVLSTLYFIFGVLQLFCGIFFYTVFMKSRFHFDEKEYDNINTNRKELVVYFSRYGYVKKKAYEKAQETGAKLLRLETTEKTDGYLGFWWCGRFAMHSWDMPLKDIGVDVSSFDKITIISPIWVFKICPPIRAFCRLCKGKIKNVSYILIHFRKDSSFEKGFDEMDSLLGIKGKREKSVCCKFGNVIKEKTF